MNELKFKEKFPELNDNQIQMLLIDLLRIIGPDIASDQVNSHKKAIRSRLQTYLHDEQPTAFNEKK